MWHSPTWSCFGLKWASFANFQFKTSKKINQNTGSYPLLDRALKLHERLERSLQTGEERSKGHLEVVGLANSQTYPPLGPSEFLSSSLSFLNPPIRNWANQAFPTFLLPHLRQLWTTFIEPSPSEIPFLSPLNPHNLFWSKNFKPFKNGATSHIPAIATSRW